MYVCIFPITEICVLLVTIYIYLSIGRLYLEAAL